MALQYDNCASPFEYPRKRGRRIRFDDRVQVGIAADYDRRNPYMHDLTAEEAAEIFDELNQYKRFEMFVHPESRYLTEFHRRFYANIDGDIPHPPTEPVPSTSCYAHEEETWPNPEVGAVQPATNEQQSFDALCDQFHSNWQSFQSLQSFQSMQTFQSLHQSFHQTMQTAFRSHFKAWHELFPPENENEVTLEHKPTPWSPFQ